VAADGVTAGMAATDFAAIAGISLPEPLYAKLVDHGRRKLSGRWIASEEQAPKAYGLMGGRLRDRTATVTHVIPLINNLRDRPDLKVEVDRLMDSVAFPSETPMERRGWVADPRELLVAERHCDAEGAVLFGAYHMHRIPWPHDPRRDTCTAIDTALAEGSGMWSFILSMVSPTQPRLRAFFEGDNDREAPIRCDDRVLPC